jgi:hypothetical protein
MQSVIDKPEIQALMQRDLSLPDSDFRREGNALQVKVSGGVIFWLKRHHTARIRQFNSPADGSWRGAGKFCIEIPIKVSDVIDKYTAPTTVLMKNSGKV